jgi:Tfp pilus assembly protein PilV
MKHMMNEVCVRRRAAGVSLIEALVALAVMAFGMLGVVGMQSTMRTGADISRQRSEAVRIAQEELERLRNYSVLRASDAASGQLAYDQIAAAAAASVAASNVNTNFVLEREVPAAAASDAMAPVRQVRVIVKWADRSASAANQRVELSSAIAGLPAELSALHATRTDRTFLAQPYGRNAAIPRAAVNNNDGTSTFTPPGLTGVTWRFDNTTALITVCAPACTTLTNRQLLSGFVAFATGDAPTSGEAEIPGDPVVSLSMAVVVTLPATALPVACATESVGTPVPDRLAYYCALPTNVSRVWSGRVQFGTLSLSGTTADATSTNYKVCRYTPRDRNLVPAAESDFSDQTISEYNAQHPYGYYRVNGPLMNKNFLVISAGGSGTVYDCPDEDTSTPLESNTWPHQPIS